MSAQHTPGPWHVRTMRDNVGRYFEVVRGAGPVRVHDCRMFGAERHARRVANVLNARAALKEAGIGE